jgi:hypothetical protein
MILVLQRMGWEELTSTVVGGDAPVEFADVADSSRSRAKVSYER